MWQEAGTERAFTGVTTNGYKYDTFEPVRAHTTPNRLGGAEMFLVCCVQVTMGGLG
jgi:hypothetical protein